MSTSSPANQPPRGGAVSQSDRAGDDSGSLVKRRNFLSKCVAIVTGGVIVAVPLAAGVAFFFDPILRKFRSAVPGSPKEGSRDGFLRVAALASLPADGRPRTFTVYTDIVDAWNKFMNQPVGRVFLRKLPDGSVTAFNVRCPHLGCAVDYRESDNDYFCPCHASAFNLDGQRENEIPPRGMDALAVKIVNGSEIWVKYQSFKAGTPDKIPVNAEFERPLANHSSRVGYALA